MLSSIEFPSEVSGITAVRPNVDACLVLRYLEASCIPPNPVSGSLPEVAAVLPVRIESSGSIKLPRSFEIHADCSSEVVIRGETRNARLVRARLF